MGCIMGPTAAVAAWLELLPDTSCLPACLLLAPHHQNAPAVHPPPPHACTPSAAEFVQPESRRNEVLGWVRSGVRDFSISRAAVEWGIPVPRDPKQTVYVWFDALNGYLSGTPLPGGLGGGRGRKFE